jgi:hypothetical protein
MVQHIFLIYNHSDHEIMQRVRQSLLAEAFSVWTDEALEPNTDAWRTQIGEAVQSADCCIVILSPDANGSSSVEQQLELVRKAGLRIFPVIGQGDEWSAIPKAFIGTQIIDVRANHDARMARLVGMIRSA